MNIARVTIDLMRPVPVAPLTIVTEVLREGRKIQLCEVKLLADGVQVVGATVLKIKAKAQALPDDVKELPVTLPSPEDSLVEDGHAATSPFVRSVSMRAARGRFGQAGAGAIWFRVDYPLIEGEAISQAMMRVGVGAVVGTPLPGRNDARGDPAIGDDVLDALVLRLAQRFGDIACVDAVGRIMRSSENFRRML